MVLEEGNETKCDLQKICIFSSLVAGVGGENKASKMSQWVKAHATKPDGLSSILWSGRLQAGKLWTK